MPEPFVVPQNILEGKGLPFPAGTYISGTSTIQQMWNETKTNLDFVLKLQENTPVEGAEVGKRPMTQRITVIFNNQSVVDVKNFDENTPFALQRSATLLSQLAVALGVATPRTKEEGGGVVFDIENFLAGLASGLYGKQAIGFEVYHRPWKSKKTGNTGISAEITRFMQAAGTSASA